MIPRRAAARGRPSHGHRGTRGAVRGQGVPEPGHREEGGAAEQARTWRPSPLPPVHQPLPGSGTQLPPWKLLPLDVELPFGGAGRRGRAQGGQRANGCPRKQLSGPCKWRAEPGLPPKRDWARAEAKGRSGAQQGTSCSSPGRRQSGPWRQGEGWGQEPSGPAPEAASSPTHLG